MSLLPASGEFVSEFPSPEVILSFPLNLDFTGLGGPTRSLRSAGIALGIMGNTRLCHHVEVTSLLEGLNVRLVNFVCSCLCNIALNVKLINQFGKTWKVAVCGQLRNSVSELSGKD
jgi:hypothetical protein